MTTHHMSGTKAYRAWKYMKTRCLNPNNHKFQSYGGRGVSVCAEWISNFTAFYSHMGEPPSQSHSVDRIDNDRGGNAEPATPAHTGAVAEAVGCPSWVDGVCDAVGHPRTPSECYCAKAAEAVLKISEKLRRELATGMLKRNPLLHHAARSGESLT